MNKVEQSPGTTLFACLVFLRKVLTKDTCTLAILKKWFNFMCITKLNDTIKEFVTAYTVLKTKCDSFTEKDTFTFGCDQCSSVTA